MSRVLLACGGTGGHLAPGIALAQRLTDEGHECLLIVSSKAVDARMTANYPRLRFVPGRGRGFGPGLLNKLRFFPALLGAVWSARALLREFKPDALVCFGGFMSVGPALAAVLAAVCYSAVAGVIAAATKLLRLGQNAAQSLLTEMVALCPAMVGPSCELPLDEIGWFNPWLDAASARHETANARLFIS